MTRATKLEELEQRIENLERIEKDKRNTIRIKNNIRERLLGYNIPLLSPEDLE